MSLEQQILDLEREILALENKISDLENSSLEEDTSVSDIEKCSATLGEVHDDLLVLTERICEKIAFLHSAERFRNKMRTAITGKAFSNAYDSLISAGSILKRGTHSDAIADLKQRKSSAEQELADLKAQSTAEITDFLITEA